ncbi:hypothetical protein BSLG_006076 [Batrachochytrium salamandrivorans]|nr:hypothetical protein BSLG_006076 [Batrachochytrium salamandrivorans]
MDQPSYKDKLESVNSDHSLKDSSAALTSPLQEQNLWSHAEDELPTLRYYCRVLLLKLDCLLDLILNVLMMGLVEAENERLKSEVRTIKAERSSQRLVISSSEALQDSPSPSIVSSNNTALVDNLMHEYKELNAILTLLVNQYLQFDHSSQVLQLQLSLNGQQSRQSKTVSSSASQADLLDWMPKLTANSDALEKDLEYFKTEAKQALQEKEVLIAKIGELTILLSNLEKSKGSDLTTSSAAQERNFMLEEQVCLFLAEHEKLQKEYDDRIRKMKGLLLAANKKTMDRIGSESQDDRDARQVQLDDLQKQLTLAKAECANVQSEFQVIKSERLMHSKIRNGATEKSIYGTAGHFNYEEQLRHLQSRSVVLESDLTAAIEQITLADANTQRLKRSDADIQMMRVEIESLTRKLEFEKVYTRMMQQDKLLFGIIDTWKCHIISIFIIPFADTLRLCIAEAGQQFWRCYVIQGKGITAEKMEQLQDMLNDNEAEIERLHNQEKVNFKSLPSKLILFDFKPMFYTTWLVLKEELRRIDRMDKRQDLNVEYLKNVVLSFIESDTRGNCTEITTKQTHAELF